MAEAQNLGINLDSKSIEILKKVDASFRDTIVNIGLRMVENTEFFNTLMGKSEDVPVEDMASLDKIEDKNTSGELKSKSKKTSPEKKAPSTSWDSF